MSRKHGSLQQPCQRCGVQTSVLLFDDFGLRMLCKACFGELVKANQIPSHSLAKVQLQSRKDVDIQKPEPEE